MPPQASPAVASWSLVGHFLVAERSPASVATGAVAAQESPLVHEGDAASDEAEVLVNGGARSLAGP
jgi:hypothetical protein